MATLGVCVADTERAIVSEFFELFKIPWEFARQGATYEFVMSTEAVDRWPAAKLVMLFASDSSLASSPSETSKTEGRFFLWDGLRLPLYAGACDASAPGFSVDARDESGVPMVCRAIEADRVVVRIGFNLFQEVRYLLTRGQPAAQAATPTLDGHVELLRSLILAAGIPVVEIPPSPLNHPFIACLTHDVDHPLLRKHRFDHTALGFVFRALFKSVADLFQGRSTSAFLLQNWLAVLKLPFVHLGLAKDFWATFVRDFQAVEKELPSTYFVIPQRGNPGRLPGGRAESKRGAAYALSDVEGQLRQMIEAGCEVGAHGIDAWVDPEAGRAEKREVQAYAASRELGVRMHWLAFDEGSPAVLDQAGFSYDSTFGYNQTVGFRAGTAMAFKPFSANRMLELPLLAMDTALLYPCYLNLSFREASSKLRDILDHVAGHGGAFVLNWHDRSLAPERCWGGVYADLVSELRARGAWCSTMSQAAAWFQTRREARIERVRFDGRTLRVDTGAGYGASGPGLKVRVHFPEPSTGSGEALLRVRSGGVDAPWAASIEMSRPAMPKEAVSFHNN